MAENVLKRFSKTAGHRNVIDEIVNLVLYMQALFSHQILDPNWTWKRNYRFQIFNIFLFTYVFFGTLQVIKNTTELDLASEAAYTLVLICLCPVKLLLFISKREVFRELYVETKSTLFEIIKQNSTDLDLMLKRAKFCIYSLFCVVAVPVGVYELCCIYFYIKGDRILLSRSTETLLSFDTPYYEITWFFHSIFLLQVSVIVIMIDIWFIFMTFFFCLSCKYLLQYLSVDKKRADEDDETYSNRLNESLRLFYDIHVKHINFLNNTKDMFKWLGMVPLISAALSICIVLVVLSEELNWKFAPHMMPLFGEVFSYCWFGEQVKTMLTKLEVGVLNFDWMNLKPKHKKNYFIIATFVKKDLGIRTAFGNNFSLITMTTVLKGSYQAYTVLQSKD